MQPMTPEEVAERLKNERAKAGNLTPAQNREFTERRRNAEAQRDLESDDFKLEDL